MDTVDWERSESTDEITIKDLVLSFRSFTRYIKSKWKAILIVSLIGGTLGLTYSIFKKPTFTATCTFVLEEGKSGGLSQYSGLASLAGIDLNSSNGSGVFHGDNILELYKSRLMVEKTLLSISVFNGKQQSLIERYITYNKLRDKWRDNDNINSINFVGKPENFSRKQDSLITDITDNFNDKYLFVTKPDKKLSIINVQFTSKDELFAKEFVNKLVQNVNDFYVQTKTKNLLEEVLILQHQADSVKRGLNLSINGVASAIESAPLANPILTSLRSSSQKKQVDLQANTAIYGEVVKNLELSKISLLQETPLIQIIDQPVLPLKKSKVNKIMGVICGSIIFFILIILALCVKKIYKKVTTEL